MRLASKIILISTFSILFGTYAHGCTISKPAVSAENEVGFELTHGERVVFLGNSLIEYAQEYGYLEYALTTRWPERDVTFRNLGWTGDTVFGEARSYYTTPPESYELLVKQLKETNPTVVFIGYGANEAYEGQEGIPAFKKGLQKLLVEIESMGAQPILLSPIPQFSGLPPEQLAIRNKNLKRYSSVIKQTAYQNEIRYIDLFSPFQRFGNKDQLTVDGIHLNETGYYYLASVMEESLGLPPREWKVDIDIYSQVIETRGKLTILQSEFKNDGVQFTLDNAILPLPPPTKDSAVRTNSKEFKIDGLAKGCYTLSIGASDVASATAGRWSKGLQISHGILFDQAQELQKLIVNKNHLYFRKYRPHNRTYLIGFRSHEQGQHSKELEQLDLFITRLEDQISQQRKPTPAVYQVEAVK